MGKIFKLNVRAAYDVMHVLIDSYYFHTYSDDIGGLAGEMMINDKNETIDPATWYEWMEAIDGNKTPVVIKKSITEEYGVIEFYEAIDSERERELPKKLLGFEEAYKAVIRFLTQYAERLESKDIKDFINELTFEKWEEAVKAELKKQ